MHAIFLFFVSARPHPSLIFSKPLAGLCQLWGPCSLVLVGGDVRSQRRLSQRGNPALALQSQENRRPGPPGGGCPQVSGPQSHLTSRHHPWDCVLSGNTRPASLEALTTGPLTGQAEGPGLGQAPALALSRCPLCEMPSAHGISGRGTAPFHGPALTRALQRAGSDPHFRAREGSSELPVSEATQPVHAMEGLTPLLSVKITHLLLAETRWEGAQHRQQ